MAFEAEAILDKDLLIITYPLVTLASFLRLMEITIGGLLLPLICLDRIFATYFVADYEKNRKTKTFLAILLFCGIQGAFIVLAGMFLIIIYPTECTIISVTIVSAVEIGTFVLYFKIVSLNRRALDCSDKTTNYFAQLIGISYNLFLTLAANGSSLLVVIIVEEWRDSVFRVWFKIIVIEDTSLKPQLETQAYFNYYANEW
ncbi:unnamed protein product, partial [Mesorhabditis belari]|uniref:Uncharacterized protein n=1 Tax=Mesorhabditis belari TaxID=2138241 RepID=A0AAF3F7Z5_9BILA